MACSSCLGEARGCLPLRRSSTMSYKKHYCEILFNTSQLLHATPCSRHPSMDRVSTPARFRLHGRGSRMPSFVLSLSIIIHPQGNITLDPLAMQIRSSAYIHQSTIGRFLNESSPFSFFLLGTSPRAIRSVQCRIRWPSRMFKLT